MLIAWFLPCTLVCAQTPFDAFSPETSRIILDGDSIADLRNEQLLLVDIATHRPVAVAPFTDEIKNWLSVDPLVDKNITTSPYLYCNGNPVMFIDPDGRDWLEAEDGTIQWTDCKSQQAMNEAKVNGRYLGEAVVVANGSYTEKIGSDKTLTDSDANPALITIYGKNGANDVREYNGLTVTSDPNLYSMISENDYLMKQEQMPTSCYANGSLTYKIYQRSGKEPLIIPTQNGEINKAYPKQGATIIGAFFHRTNWDGNAYGNPAAGHPVSSACILIDGRQWRFVEKQLGKSQNIFLRLMR